MSHPERALRRVSRLLDPAFFADLEAARRAERARGEAPGHEDAWIGGEAFQAVLERRGGRLWRGAVQAAAAGDLGSQFVHDFFALYALANWRLTRGVYDFDPTLAAALQDTELDDIPSGVLRRMPEYAPYFPLGGMRFGGLELHGAWVCKVPGPDGTGALSFALHHGGDRLQALSVVVPPDGGRIDAMIDGAFASMGRVHGGQADPGDLPERSRHLVRTLLGRALYLCSREPDLRGVVRKPTTSGRPVKGGWEQVHNLPAANNVLEVGYRHGGAIRMWQELQAREGSDSSGLGLPRAPHIRRAHWHLYWTGPGRTVPEVRWIAPTPVNVRDPDALPAHARPVLGDPGEDRQGDAAWRRDNRVALQKLQR